jgi:hypothetical protein
VPSREPIVAKFDMAPLCVPDGDGPVEVPTEVLEDLAAGRVEVTTEDVAGILREAEPCSTVK